jgi:uncharacterized membrane protein
MSALFYILAIAAMLMVVASLAMGLFFMARGRESDAVRSNKMMHWRIYLQAGAIILFLLSMAFGKS